MVSASGIGCRLAGFSPSALTVSSRPIRQGVISSIAAEASGRILSVDYSVRTLEDLEWLAKIYICLPATNVFTLTGTYLPTYYTSVPALIKIIFVLFLKSSVLKVSYGH